MVATADDIARDEQERGNLLRVIADVETVIAVSTPGTRRVLENTVENARKRIAVLDKMIEEAKVEHAAEVKAQVAAATALAAKESKLSAEEKETYRSFLEKDYFTKKDFGKLDQFYAHSYARLSEDGKEEMSKRIDEGIRRGEFKFDDLPKHALEKEVEHRVAKANKIGAVHREANDSKNFSHPTNAAAKDIDLRSLDLSGIRLAEAADSPSASSLPDVSGTKIVER